MQGTAYPQCWTQLNWNVTTVQNCLCLHCCVNISFITVASIAAVGRKKVYCNRENCWCKWSGSYFKVNLKSLTRTNTYTHVPICACTDIAEAQAIFVIAHPFSLSLPALTWFIWLTVYEKTAEPDKVLDSELTDWCSLWSPPTTVHCFLFSFALLDNRHLYHKHPNTSSRLLGACFAPCYI